MVLALAALLGGPAAAVQDDEGGGEVDARLLYLQSCASCHGADGGGVSGRGPSLLESGEAAAYYYLSTGRMPLADSDEPRRKPPVFEGEELDALVEYVGSLGDGPSLPDLPAGADLAVGGELFRAQCQACHSASGSGGALSYAQPAPPLAAAEDLEIAAAVRSGPGEMPVFGPDLLDDQDVADIVGYVQYLDDPADPGGFAIGRLGPIPEGFVAWFVGMAALLGIVAWIGTRERS